MPLDSRRREELVLHSMKRFGVPVLKVSKRLPKPKHLRPTKWPKNNRHGIELPIAPKVMERQASDRQAPPLALRPIQNNSSLTEVR